MYSPLPGVAREMEQKTQLKKKAAKSANRMVPAAQPKGQSRARRKLSRLAGGDNRIVVKHAEYFADVRRGTQISSYAINPGNSTMFPWLCGIAKNYESYTFISLRFRYKTCCPALMPGSVALAVDYDANDPAPTTKQAMYSYHGLVNSPQWRDATLRCEPANMNKVAKRFVVIDGSYDPNPDVRLTDVGNLLVGSFSESAVDGQAGELWVEYEIEFHTPQATSPPLTVGGSLYCPSRDPYHPLVRNPESTLAMPYSVDEQSSEITFPTKGKYLVTVKQKGKSLAQPPEFSVSGISAEMDALVAADGSQALKTVWLSAPGIWTLALGATKLLDLASTTISIAPYKGFGMK